MSVDSDDDVESVNVKRISQAERVIAKFGGARNLMRAMHRAGKDITPATIYKWTYPRSKEGTDGIIPSWQWPDILEAARLEGIVFTSEDVDPREEILPAAPMRNVRRGTRPPRGF